MKIRFVDGPLDGLELSGDDISQFDRVIFQRLPMTLSAGGASVSRPESVYAYDMVEHKRDIVVFRLEA